MRTVLAVVALALLIAVPAVAKKPVPEPPANQSAPSLESTTTLDFSKPA